MFQVIKGKLKQAKEGWQKYLEGKTLVLCTSISGRWALCAIEGEENLDGMCKFVWGIELEHDYETLEDMQEDVSLGNYGFAFETDEIEVLQVLASYEF